jgi:BASS family bile acid:Na+ symporter
MLVEQHLPADFVMPAGQIAREIALILLLPLALGMLCLHWFADFAPKFSKVCIRISVFTILLIVIGATGSGRVDLERFGQYNLMIVMLFLAAVSILSWLIPHLCKVKKPDNTAINIEATVRNGNLGLLIKASLFPAAVGVSDPIGDNILFTVLAYGGAALLVGVGQIYLHRYRNRNEAVRYPP